MKKILIAVAALLTTVAAGCSDAPSANRALRQMGYNHVETNGHAFFACGRDDSYATKFTATAPNGEQVTGAVCAGLFKNSTVRFD